MFNQMRLGCCVSLGNQRFYVQCGQSTPFAPSVLLAVGHVDVPLPVRQFHLSVGWSDHLIPNTFLHAYISYMRLHP